jgi:hypothetical protein
MMVPSTYFTTTAPGFYQARYRPEEMHHAQAKGRPPAPPGDFQRQRMQSHIGLTREGARKRTKLVEATKVAFDHPLASQLCNAKEEHAA